MSAFGSFGRGIVRVAPLLAAVAFLVVMGWLGTRGQGPLGQIDALRSVGGLPPATTPGTRTGADGPDGTVVPSDGSFSGIPTEPGLCATWVQSVVESDRATHRVACADPHLLEVAATFEIDGTPYGETGPTDREWLGAPSDRCDELIEAYLGYPLDERGRFQPNLFHPVDADWRRGDRTVICGISVPEVPPAGEPIDETLEPTTGKVAGADQTFLFPTGTCIEGGEPTAYRSVPCDGPHVFEIVGATEVAVPAGDPYPGADAIAALTADGCRALAESIYGGPLPPDITTSVAEPAASSWEAGTRTVSCFLASVGPDGAPVEVGAPLRAPAGG